VRIAFFDINLYHRNIDLNQTTFDYTQDPSLRAVFNDLAHAIGIYISPSNGPFALIFWTSNTVLITNFISYVNTRAIALPSPILINGIDKDAFLLSATDDNGLTIKDRINQILDSSPIKLLFEFEETAQNAASYVINQIYDIIPSTDAWGENQIFNSNLEKVF